MRPDRDINLYSRDYLRRFRLWMPLSRDTPWQPTTISLSPSVPARHEEAASGLRKGLRHSRSHRRTRLPVVAQGVTILAEMPETSQPGSQSVPGIGPEQPTQLVPQYVGHPGEELVRVIGGVGSLGHNPIDDSIGQ